MFQCLLFKKQTIIALIRVLGHVDYRIETISSLITLWHLNLYQTCIKVCNTQHHYS